MSGLVLAHPLLSLAGTFVVAFFVGIVAGLAIAGHRAERSLAQAFGRIW